MTSITIHTDDLMSVQNAAKKLGRPRLAIYRMIKRKALNGIKLGGTTFVPTLEVDEILKGGEKKEKNEPAKNE
jgi:excisionase family DNA binding protein